MQRNIADILGRCILELVHKQSERNNEEIEQQTFLNRNLKCLRWAVSQATQTTNLRIRSSAFSQTLLNFQNE